MTVEQWQDSSADVRDELEDWQQALTRMIKVLNAWSTNPPPPVVPGPGSQEGSNEDEPSLNSRLWQLMQVTATVAGAQRGQALLDWVNDCLSILQGYDKAFAQKPNDPKLDQDAQTALDQIQAGYDKLHA